MHFADNDILIETTCCELTIYSKPLVNIFSWGQSHSSTRTINNNHSSIYKKVISRVEWNNRWLLLHRMNERKGRDTLNGPATQQLLSLSSFTNIPSLPEIAGAKSFLQLFVEFKSGGSFLYKLLGLEGTLLPLHPIKQSTYYSRVWSIEFLIISSINFFDNNRIFQM